MNEFPMAVSMQLETVGTRKIAPSSGMTSRLESSSEQDTAPEELVGVPRMSSPDVGVTVCVRTG